MVCKYVNVSAFETKSVGQALRAIINKSFLIS